MIIQYAHFLKEVWAKKVGHNNLSVYADVICALNDRPSTRMIDPNVDLAKEKESFSYPRWLLPLNDNLRVGSGEML